MQCMSTNNNINSGSFFFLTAAIELTSQLGIMGKGKHSSVIIV